ELLHRHGLDVNGIPDGVPPLAHMMSWAVNPAGPRWLLEHGADANRSWGDDGEAPLHLAAWRWNVPMVELLVRYGADVSQRRAGGALRQCRYRRMARLARGERRALPARALHRRMRARRSRRRGGNARRAARPAIRAETRAPSHASSAGRARERCRAGNDARVR